jgi:hypothetical protein
VFGDEADSFLKKRGIHLVGETFEKFVRAYIAAKEQAELAPKTRRAWGAKIRHLVAFIKHDDLARLTKKDLVAWKDEQTGRKQAKRQDRAERLSRVGEGDLAILKRRWRRCSGKGPSIRSVRIGSLMRKSSAPGTGLPPGERAKGTKIVSICQWSFPREGPSSPAGFRLLFS